MKVNKINEKKKMKRRLLLLLAGTSVLLLTIWYGFKFLEREGFIPQMYFTIDFNYRTFDDAISEVSTDVVIAQYIRSRRFGRNLTEFEFSVSDRILGNAADRIFVYASNTDTHIVSGGDVSLGYRPNEITFDRGVDYLLPLSKISNVYANTHDDGFRFIRVIAVDLDNPSNSVMYNEPLASHSEVLDFNGQLSREEIISWVEGLTQDNPLALDFIRSEDIEDIINESPYVLVIEVGDSESLLRDSNRGDWVSTDLYNVTVIESLKGDIDVGAELVVIFFANTVLPGEQHIVAVEQIPEGSFYQFTSRNSLFSLDNLDEIVAIIENE